MSDLFEPQVTSSAILSDCKSYRYRLERRWDMERPRVAFVMLNPSTADANLDDPTIRRCIGFAKAWGFGGLIVGNLFALRSTDPKALYSHSEPIGPDNDRHLLTIADDVDQIICAWGTNGALHGRGKAVVRMLRGRNMLALKVTSDGSPGHPLYLPAAAQRQTYHVGEGQ